MDKQDVKPIFKPEIGNWNIRENEYMHQPVDEDGNQADRERAILRFKLPCYAKSMKISVLAEYDPAHSISIRTSEWARSILSVNLGPDKITLTDECRIEVFDYPKNKAKGLFRIDFVCEVNSTTLLLDNTKIGSFERNYKKPYSEFEFFTYGKSKWSDLTVSVGDTSPFSYSPQLSKNFSISTSADMVMDLLRVGYHFLKQDLNEVEADWEFILNQYMQSLAGAGNKKVNWVINEYLPNRVNELAVKAAHEAGLQFFVTLKLFDVGDTDFSNRGANRGEASLYGYDHPEVYSLRAPLLDEHSHTNKAIEKVCIFKNDCEPFDEGKLNLWVSDDGLDYRVYTGEKDVSNDIVTKAFIDVWDRRPCEPVQVRCITFDKLNIKEKYVAVTCEHGSHPEFYNHLYRLMEVYDRYNKQVHIQYGLRLNVDEKTLNDASRKKGTLTFNYSASNKFPAELLGNDLTGKERCRLDFVWNRSHSLANGSNSGFDDAEAFYSLDNGIGVIGLKRDFEPRAERTFSPAVPAARKFFLDWVDQWLQWGADGIDLRVRTHARTPCMSDLHFNPEVQQAYSKKYGEELNFKNYDREKHQLLMGDFYSSLVKEISARVHERGKILFHHINHSTLADPATEQCLLGIHYDWKKWIEQKWIDGVTFKEVKPGNEIFDEVMPMVKKHGLQSYLSVHILNVFNKYKYENCVSPYFEEARDAGLDGYDIYEASSYIHGKPSGEFTVVADQIPGLIERFSV